ncbi:MAG: hypothetical protein ACI9BF_000843 [Candidatus Paceibacteria bacterium]|jgi:hypothetical protein
MSDLVAYLNNRQNDLTYTNRKITLVLMLTHAEVLKIPVNTTNEAWDDDYLCIRILVLKDLCQRVLPLRLSPTNSNPHKRRSEVISCELFNMKKVPKRNAFRDMILMGQGESLDHTITVTVVVDELFVVAKWRLMFQQQQPWLVC